MKKALATISILLVWSLASLGQKSDIKKGDQAFHNLRFSESNEHYQKVYDKDIDNYSVIKNAESFYNIKNYERSLKWYDRAHDKGFIKTAEQVQEYLHCQLASDIPIERRQKIIEHYAIILKEAGMVTGVEDSETHIFDKIEKLCFNSEFDDHAPFIFEDEIFFYSSRASNKSASYNYNGQAFGRLYSSKIADCKPELLNESKNEYISGIKNMMKDDLHMGPICIAYANKLAFVNVNHEKPSEDETYHLKIMVGKNNGRKWAWGNFRYNDEAYSIQHPFYNDEDRRLYFSSNMPGGKGGYDLYYSINSDTGFTKPSPLEEVNTASDEVAPFVDENGKLFFSSRGYLNHGGFDILSYTSENGVESLPKPINSLQNDLFYTQHNQKVYFSSDRNGFGDGDIFSANVKELNTTDLQIDLVDEVEKPDILLENKRTGEQERIAEMDRVKVIVQDTYNLTIKAYGYVPFLGDIKVELVNGDEAIIKKIKLEKVKENRAPVTLEPVTYVDNKVADAAYEVKDLKTSVEVIPNKNIFILERGNNYLITTEVEGFEPQDRTIVVPDDAKVIKLDPFYFSTPEPGTTIEEPAYATIQVDDIYFNFDKSNIKPSAQEKLNDLLEVLRLHPEAKIRLDGHTDSRGSNAYNRKLSKRRIDSTVDYLKARGVGMNRIVFANWFGEERLLNECTDGANCPERKHYFNRRVEVKLVQY